MKKVKEDYKAVKDNNACIDAELQICPFFLNFSTQFLKIGQAYFLSMMRKHETSQVVACCISPVMIVDTSNMQIFSKVQGETPDYE